LNAPHTAAPAPWAFFTTARGAAAGLACWYTCTVTVDIEVSDCRACCWASSDSSADSRCVSADSRLMTASMPVAWFISARTRSTLVCSVFSLLATSTTCWVTSWVERSWSSTVPRPSSCW